MDAYVQSGRVADVLLLVILAEAVWLTVKRRAPLSVLVALGPGACLVLALRFALTGESWMWIAAALSASLPLHLADLRRRPLGRRRSRL